MKNIIELNHPLITHKLAILRDKNTGTKEFRELISELSSFLCYEALRDAKLKEVDLKYGKTITSDVFDLYCDDEQKFRSNFPDMNFLSVEMEAFGLFYIAKKLGKEAGCLMTVVDSLFDKRSLTAEQREKSLNDMIELALESIIE